MIQPVILAAGKGSRLKSDKPKPLFEVAGKPMIRFALDELSQIEDAKTAIIVTGYGAEMVEEYCGPQYRFARQVEQNGTASAVAAALPLVSDNPVLVLYADHPFITAASISRIKEVFEKENPMIAMFTVTLPDFEEWRSAFRSFGRVLRNDEGGVKRIVEYKNATEAERSILEVNPGVYCFNAAWLKANLPKVQPNAETGEFYLTDLVEMAILGQGQVITVPLPPREAVGINSIDDAKAAEKRGV